MKKALLFLLVGSAQAADLQFTWDIPTQRTDGSTLFTNEIYGYTLYENGYEIKSIVGGSTIETTYLYDGYGQPCYTISTTDIWQQEGPQSPEVCINVFPAPPGSPVRLDTSL